MSKTAVVLFNLGGPDSLDAVKPFLFNLFNDPAIIGAPTPIRLALAHFISSRRAPIAREIYAKMGGKSPILENTIAQAQALESLLQPKQETKVFICMRYWHPMSKEVVAQVKAYQPDTIVLLPLYPQFSTSTTASSLKDWREESKRQGLHVPTFSVGCYPLAEGFVSAQAALIEEKLNALGDTSNVRVLFSAHGLPEKIIEKGDPYQWQVEQSAHAIAAKLAHYPLEWLVSYQSRVGPLKWIGPATDEEIKRAGNDKKDLIVVPLAFVSEHSETLVELDIEYGELAHHSGVKSYHRVSTVQAHTQFIEALAQAVTEAVEGKNEGKVVACGGKRLCPSKFSQCACA